MSRVLLAPRLINSTQLEPTHSFTQPLTHLITHLLTHLLSHCIAEEFGEIFSFYCSAVFGEKVKIIRSNSSLGLIKARLLGSRIAIGDVIVSMDAHMEVQDTW